MKAVESAIATIVLLDEISNMNRQEEYGLTQLEYFAAAALTGVLISSDDMVSPRLIALKAVESVTANIDLLNEIFNMNRQRGKGGDQA